MPSPRLFINTATHKAASWTGGTEGTRTRNPVGTEDVLCSVQPMSADRQLEYDMPLGVTAWTIYYPADPGLATDDLVLWGGRTASVLAPARDMAGRGAVWALDCRVVS